MSKYIATNTDLTSIANAIRTAGGTSAQLEFPTGFVNAIGNISGGGGGGNVVSGSFTGTTAGDKAISVPYTGSGFPIAVMIFVADGADNSSSSYYSLVQRYAISILCILKKDTSAQPEYSSSNVSQNYGVDVLRYKNSTTDATAYTTGSQDCIYCGANNLDGSSIHKILNFTNSTTMNVHIATSDRGFAKDIEYGYAVVYSE